MPENLPEELREKAKVEQFLRSLAMTA